MSTLALSRRQALRFLSVGAACGTSSRAIAELQKEQSLRAIAQSNGIIFGAAASSAIDSDEAYRHLYQSQTASITTDAALKMSMIAGKPGKKYYDAADRLLQFCKSHDVTMHGHCLIWNEWVPSWIKAMDNRERRQYFDAYIEEVVSRYRGKLSAWDIVNEPFWPGHMAPGGFRVGPWFDAFGPDYIRRAFERAAMVDQATPFVLNEAQTERDDDLGLAIRANLLRLVGKLKDAGVRLDAVGLQSHLQPRYPYDPDKHLKFLHELAQHGVDIYLSELDVNDDVFPNDIEARDRMVAEVAQRYLDNVLQVPAVKAVIVWELSDKYSSYDAAALAEVPAPNRIPRPLPYDGNMERKPLWFAIARALRNARKG